MEKAWFGALMQAAEGALDYEAIFKAKDPGSLVRQMPELDLYQMVQERGLNDSLELLALASSDQVQAMLDFEVWRGEHIAHGSLKNWLKALMELPDECFVAAFEELDPELLPLFLKRHLIVWLFEDPDQIPQVPDEDERPLVESPDGVYHIQYPADEEDSALCRALIERVYELLGVSKGWMMLESARWELESGMEESAYRFRSARLEDYGFPEAQQALELLAPLSVGEAKALLEQDFALGAGHTMKPLRAALSRLGEEQESLFAQAIKELDQEAGAALEVQLGRVVNSLARLEKLEPVELKEAVEPLAKLSAGVLNIGLERLCEGHDLDQATHILERLPIKHLFRVGMGALNTLKEQVNRLQQDGLISIIDEHPDSLLTSDQQDLCAGLTLTIPRRSVVSLKAFQTQEEVEEAASALAEIAYGVLILYGVLRFSRQDIVDVAYLEALVGGPSSVSLEKLLATLVLRRHLGEPSLTPFALAELPRERAELEAAFDQWTLPPMKQQPLLERAGERLFGRIREEVLAELAQDGDLDARYIGSLLVIQSDVGGE